jgi:hypothetical protein
MRSSLFGAILFSLVRCRRLFRRTPLRDAAASDGDSHVVLPDCHNEPHSALGANKLWAEILPPAEKQLRLEQNKTLG